MLPTERQLLTDRQIREASVDQIEDLVQRINLVMQGRGTAGLVWRATPEDSPESSDRIDPRGTIGSE
jgi:hypothetical protein